MTRARRLGFELALLPLLYVLSVPSRDVFVALISGLLLFPPAINWTVAAILIWTSKQAPEIESLRERADDAVTLALMATGGAAAGAVQLATLAGVVIPGRPILAVLAWVLILVSVPALGWLRTWRDVWLPHMRRSIAADAEAEGTVE